jgi:hypothetical protein
MTNEWDLQRLRDVVHFNEIQSKSGSAERPSFNRILCRIDRQMALFPEEDGPSVAGGKSAETE